MDYQRKRKEKREKQWEWRSSEAGQGKLGCSSYSGMQGFFFWSLRVSSEMLMELLYLNRPMIPKWNPLSLDSSSLYPPIRPLLSSSKHQSTPFMSSPYPVSVQPCSPSSNGPSWTRPKGKAQSKDDTQNQPEAQTNSYVVWAQPWDSVLGQSDLNQMSPLLWTPISQDKSWPDRKAEETDSTLTILKYKHQRNWFCNETASKGKADNIESKFCIFQWTSLNIINKSSPNGIILY